MADSAFGTGIAMPTQLGTPTSSSADTAASQRSAGPSGGGGTQAKSEKERYYEDYRAVAAVLGMPFNKKLAAKAYAKRLPASGYLVYLRKYDKKYMKTDEYANRAAQYLIKYKQYFPAKGVSLKDMRKFVRGEWSTERLDIWFRRTKMFKEQYPYMSWEWQLTEGPEAYREWTRTVNSYYQKYLSRIPTESEVKWFFSKEMTSQDRQEFEQRMQIIAQGSPIVQWFQGKPLTKEEQQAVLFGQPTSETVRGRIAQAIQTQQSLFSSKPASPPLQRSEAGDIVQPI